MDSNCYQDKIFGLNRTRTKHANFYTTQTTLIPFALCLWWQVNVDRYYQYWVRQAQIISIPGSNNPKGNKSQSSFIQEEEIQWLHCIISVLLLPRAHAQGVKQSVCMSVVVGMKIASSGDLGICTCCNNDESVDIGEKLVSARLKLLKMAY